jgi:hypothetical protein
MDLTDPIKTWLDGGREPGLRVLGWLLLIGAIIEGVQAFRQRKTGQFLLHLLAAVLSVVVGFVVLSIYFIAGGWFRFTAGIATRLASWDWLLFNDIVTQPRSGENILAQGARSCEKSAWTVFRSGGLQPGTLIISELPARRRPLRTAWLNFSQLLVPWAKLCRSFGALLEDTSVDRGHFNLS